jgi:hypothetical protein
MIDVAASVAQSFELETYGHASARHPTLGGSRLIDGAVSLDQAICELLAILVNETEYDPEAGEGEFKNVAGDAPIVTITYEGSSRTEVVRAGCGS